MERQTNLAFGARDAERFQLLNNLRLLGRSSASGRVRALVELVARIAGDGELQWTIDGPPDARDCLCERLNLPSRTMRRTIADAESCGALLVRRCRRSDRTYDRLALRVNWQRLAARELFPLTDDRVISDGKAVRPSWPDGPAKLAAPVRPSWPECPANLAGQYRLDKQIPPPPPTHTATATAADPSGDTGPEGTSWEAAAEALRGTGFASWRRLVADCQRRGLSAGDLVTACETYAANKARFRGPGAIASWVRDGDWPVDGVKPVEEARVRLVTTERNREATELERWAQSVIMQCRKAGMGRDQIAGLLAKRGYVWA